VYAVIIFIYIFFVYSSLDVDVTDNFITPCTQDDQNVCDMSHP